MEEREGEGSGGGGGSVVLPTMRECWKKGDGESGTTWRKGRMEEREGEGSGGGGGSVVLPTVRECWKKGEGEYIAHEGREGWRGERERGKVVLCCQSWTSFTSWRETVW